MDTENITSETLPGGTHVESADGGEAVGSEVTSEPSIKISDLKKILGKDFKDADTALKSIQDTYNYVGKAGQVKKELKEVKSKLEVAATTDDFASLKESFKALQEDNWYEKNPQYKAVRNLISKIPGNPNEVVSTPEFKELFSKSQGFEENQKLKSVLEPNPRLASVSTGLSKALDASNKGQKGLAADLATSAVMEAYKM